LETPADPAALKPAVDCIKTDSAGKPYLEGHKCSACGEVFMETRRGCPKCFAVGTLAPVKLSDKGKLYNWTVVYRNFPGVPVPFVSAIVDLEGGGTLKGNLIEVEPDPAKLKFDMPVKVVFGDAGRTDKAGNHYLAYFFAPEAA
jgi:uncharacterized OB-fold protein